MHMNKRQAEARAFHSDNTKLRSFLRKVNRKLVVYGTERHGNRRNPLEELVFIILSAQTESYLYIQTFKDLRRRFPTWNSLSTAAEAEIETVIRHGGLAKKKAAQLKSSLEKIRADTGRLSLRFLRTLSDEEVRAYLTTLPGTGNKSASCIMLYSLGRSVFPVDTHVWRICRRLGLTAPVAKPSRTMELELEAKIPKSLRYSLHVNLISHGRRVCTTYWPKCQQCVLAEMCPSKDLPDHVWANFRRPSGFWARAVPTKS
jgi:endonuclease III